MIAEGRHQPGPGRWWAETWCFEVVQPDVAALACLTLLPAQQRAWYWSWAVRPDRPVVLVSDLEVRLPARRLEIRGNELWADHVVEELGQRWTIGNEANAIALDDPADAFGPGYGVPTPLGIDGEWEASADPVVQPHGYVVPALVHGEVLVGSGRIELDGPGRWWHRWGVLEPWAPVAAPHGTTWAGLRVDLDDRSAELAYWLDGDGWCSGAGPLSAP